MKRIATFAASAIAFVGIAFHGMVWAGESVELASTVVVVLAVVVMFCAVIFAIGTPLSDAVLVATFPIVLAAVTLIPWVGAMSCTIFIVCLLLADDVAKSARTKYRWVAGVLCAETATLLGVLGFSSAYWALGSAVLGVGGILAISHFAAR